MSRLPKALFISHGGGPLPLLGDAGHREMVSCLERIASSIPKPEAIVIVSAHWEESVPTITATPNPALIYDYYGFPEESYSIQYPCIGQPSLASELHGMLSSAGVGAELDHTRGLDHGVFVPLKIMYPQADVPCVQLSLVRSLDAALHIEMGRALAELSARDVLLIGSGFSFHNLRSFFAAETSESRESNRSFEDWLQRTCSDRDIGEKERMERLIRWSGAEGARFCHPREDHLIPLHVCYGAGQGPCAEVLELQILGKISSMYLW